MSDDLRGIFTLAQVIDYQDGTSLEHVTILLEDREVLQLEAVTKDHHFDLFRLEKETRESESETDFDHLSQTLTLRLLLSDSHSQTLTLRLSQTLEITVHRSE